MLILQDLKQQPELDYINMVWFSIMSMNTTLVGLLLDDTIDYEDIGKKAFIEKLNTRFNNHKTHGDSELLLDIDYCKGCHCDLPVCKFVGNHSGKHFALYFELIDGYITDIYHCNWYGDMDILDSF